MKKTCLILVAIALIFGLAGCGTDLSNGTSMIITKVEISDLPKSYEGKVMSLRGDFGGDATWNAGSNNPYKGTVTKGTLTIDVNPAIITSAPQVECKICTVGGWDDEIKSSLDNGANPYFLNTWTGPAVAKTVKGTGVKSEWVAE